MPPVRTDGSSVSVQAKGTSAGEIFVRDGGTSVQVRNSLRTACQVLTWDGNNKDGRKSGKAGRWLWEVRIKGLERWTTDE